MLSLFNDENELDFTFKMTNNSQNTHGFSLDFTTTPENSAPNSKDANESRILHSQFT